MLVVDKIRKPTRHSANNNCFASQRRTIVSFSRGLQAEWPRIRSRIYPWGGRLPPPPPDVENCPNPLAIFYLAALTKFASFARRDGM
jgi:hypothetical protein